MNAPFDRELLIEDLTTVLKYLESEIQRVSSLGRPPPQNIELARDYLMIALNRLLA